MNKPDSRLSSSIPIAIALAMAAILFGVISMGLSGCSGSSLDWKSAFEKSDALANVLPSNDCVNESPYKVTDFRTEVSESASNPDRQACTFGATVENDYFIMEISGTGEEASKDGDMRFEVSQRQYCKAKAPIDVLGESEWYLDDLAFTLSDDGASCSAEVDKEIETWFGTVHAEGSIEAKLENATESSPSKQPKWIKKSDVKLSLAKFSDKILGDYAFARNDTSGSTSDAAYVADGIVKQFSLSGSTPGQLRIEFEQPEFSHLEFSKAIVGTPKQWESPSRHAALTENDDADFVASVDGGFRYTTILTESYPCPHDANYEMHDNVNVTISSNAEGEIRLDGTFLATRPKALGSGYDEYHIWDADKKNILLLNGTFSK